MRPGEVGEELVSWVRGLERGERVSWVVEGWCGAVSGSCLGAEESLRGRDGGVRGGGGGLEAWVGWW